MTTRTPALVLHGFTQTAASNEPFISALAGRGMAAESVDLPGHGTGNGSDHLVTTDLWHGAADVVDALGDDTPRVWIGYSMGARLALHVAMARPAAVGGLVLISGTAGIDDPGERAARRVSDGRLADHIEDVGVEAFLVEWLAKDLFAGLPDDPDRITRRATNTAAGLASSLRRWGTGTMDPPLWDRLAAIDAPTLVITGEHDTKFTGLGRRLAAGIGPHASHVIVPGVGHTVHLEAPDATATIVSDWTARHFE